MSKIKIGQIGTGHGHAKGKMEVLRTLPDFEVVGVVEPDEHLRQRAQREKAYQGLRWMSEQQLLNTPGLQAVAVETRVADLLDVAERALAADLHIHLDKPAGTSLKQFERLLDTAARKHRLVQMGYMYRYNPAFVMLRKWLADGWLGEPFEVHAVMSKVVSPSKRQRFAIFSGGMMFELGCHLIDLVVGMFGVPDSIRPFVRHVAADDDKLNDNMLAVFEYPRLLASVKSSALEVEGFARRHFVVCGTEGTCHIQPLDRPAVRVVFDRDRGPYRKHRHATIEVGDYPRYVADLRDMARIIRGEKDPDYSYAHDLAVQEAVLRASAMPLDA